MELKSGLSIIAFMCAGSGLFAAGCSQQSMGSQQILSSQQQQAVEAPAEVAPAPVQAPVSRPPPPRPVVPPVKVPPVKAKGNYKGAVQMDDSSKDVMQQYQR